MHFVKFFFFFFAFLECFDIFKLRINFLKNKNILYHAYMF